MPRLRELSLGPYAGTMVRWSYHDGSTWALVLFLGEGMRAENIAGWCVVTAQEEPYPVIGVFVDPAYRGHGHATRLVSASLTFMRQHITTDKIYAVAERWPQYERLIAQAGYEHLEWC